MKPYLRDPLPRVATQPLCKKFTKTLINASGLTTETGKRTLPDKQDGTGSHSSPVPGTTPSDSWVLSPLSTVTLTPDLRFTKLSLSVRSIVSHVSIRKTGSCQEAPLAKQSPVNASLPFFKSLSSSLWYVLMTGWDCWRWSQSWFLNLPWETGAKSPAPDKPQSSLWDAPRCTTARCWPARHGLCSAMIFIYS